MAIEDFKGHHVLPAQSSTPMERALADVAADNILPVDVPIDTLWDPWTCPEPYLPFLAWALSVDVWDADWPIDIKRRVIAASPEVHRRKGTRYAVRLALEAIGISTDIVEWWQASPPARRGTFSVTAFINEQVFAGLPIINERMQHLAQAAIKASKPKSRVYDFKLGVRFKNDLGLVPVVPPPLMIDRRPVTTGPDTDLKKRLALVGAVTPLSIARQSLSVGIDTATRARVGIAGALSNVQILRVQMEAAA